MSAGDNFRIYGRKTVLDAARERIAWVFDEFPNVVVNVSGGKDSTVIFHLAMEVARAKGRLPLTVRFIDQEAEWQATIDVIRSIMEHPDVNPRWYQMPIVLFNATSTQEHWLRCWAPEDEHRWMRPREPYAITENVYGTERFAELFPATLATEYPNTPTAVLTGVRVEESPGRAAGLTGAAVIKGRTWGRVENRKLQHFAWHPLYDWSYMDVWKAIHERGWKYNRIYDHQYQWGLSVLKMRVSNVHHETSVGSLWYMQEAEPETYARLTARISGVDAATKAGARDYVPKTLPFAFASWREYRDFLLEKLIEKPEWREGFRKKFAEHDRIYTPTMGDRVHKVHVRAILLNDWEHVILTNFERDREPIRVRLRNKGVNPW